MRAVAALGIAAVAVLLAAMTLALPGPTSVDQADALELTWRQNEILVVRARTHACTDQLGRHRLRVEQRIITGGPAYRRWVLHLWRKRASLYCKAARDLVLPATNDWLTAVRVVQRVFPGSAGWLIACSASEGGHGRWVPQRDGGTPGGWMQYMPGTFWTDYLRARDDARRRGFIVPSSAASWYSPLGQALAAGWAYHHDRPAGKWTGETC